MKKVIQSVLLALLNTCAFGQGMFGGQLGVGYCSPFKSYFTPSFDGYYFAKASSNIYLGGAISIQRYSFLDNVNAGSPSYGDVVSVRQESSYIYFSPKADCGIGYRKRVHLNLSAGPGVFMGGNKWTNKYEPVVSSSGGYSAADTISYNTNATMRTLLFHVEFGVWERIPTHGYWNITLWQEFNYITSKLNYPGTQLKTNFFAFSIGIMHKYPHVAVEE